MDLRLAVLGDSIAWGQGASQADDRPAQRLARALAEHGIEVTTHVTAVPGARSADLAGQVERTVPWRPDLVTLVIGANDLTHQVPAQAAAHDLGDAVRRLVAAGAEVVVAPAPDLSAVPLVPVGMRALIRARSDALRRLQVDEVRRHGGRVADADHATSGVFAVEPAMFSADRFHPSSAGYAVIAAALLPELLAAARERLAAPPD
jgi:lysophospholipase L1-like esterase